MITSRRVTSQKYYFWLSSFAREVYVRLREALHFSHDIKIQLFSSANRSKTKSQNIFFARIRIQLTKVNIKSVTVSVSKSYK